MSREDIYMRAFQSLLDGGLSKKELWEVLNEHFEMLDADNFKLKKMSDEYRAKYEHLLNQVNEAHKAHEQYFKH